MASHLSGFFLINLNSLTLRTKNYSDFVSDDGSSIPLYASGLALKGIN